MPDSARPPRELLESARLKLRQGRVLTAAEAGATEAALGEQLRTLRPDRGDLVDRDRLLVTAARRHWPQTSVRNRARLLHAALLRYQATAWRAEWDLPAVPPERRGTFAETAWRMLQIADVVPSEERLRKILGRETCQ